MNFALRAKMLRPEIWGRDDDAPSRNHNWGVAKLVKAPDFDSGIRGFESYLPSQHNMT